MGHQLSKAAQKVTDTDLRHYYIPMLEVYRQLCGNNLAAMQPLPLTNNNYSVMFCIVWEGKEE